MTARLVAVFGYSRGGDTLHEICASRVRRAEAEARAGDVVLLSGWSRHRAARSEAELMAEAWNGPPVELVVAPDARTTYGNARAAAALARSRRATEVVLVTSRWHARRASSLLRSTLRGSGIGVTLASADGPAARLPRARELACWAIVPAQAASVRYAQRRDSERRAEEVSAPASER